MQPITFGLTGREFQTSFNVEKYVALAYQQPRGKLLQELVELDWVEWCDRVSQSPWKAYWRRSKYWKQQCTTPGDMLCLDGSCGGVPLVIFSSAVWGFGVEGWLKKTGRAANAPLYELLKLQGVSNPKSVRHRTHMIDDKLYRGCRLVLPAEFGELDRWLEPLWQKACKQFEDRLMTAAQPLLTPAT